MKIAIVSLVLVLLAVVGGAFVVGPDMTGVFGEINAKPRGKPVRVMAVTTAPLVEFVSAPGEVEPHTKVEISSEVSAQIEALPVLPGDEVRKGDLVAKLDDADLKAALESASARRDGEHYRLQSEQAMLSGMISNLEFARRELERQRALHESGDVSRKTLDEAEERVRDLEARESASRSTISVIESSMAAAEADITRARDGLENTVILAPMDGVVTGVYMEVGEQVLGTFQNIGSRIMTVANLERMILTAQVRENDIAAVKVGQKARIHINAYQNEVFSGRVTLIALERTLATDGTGVFEVEIEIDLQGRRIYSGLAANVDIEIAERRGHVVESQAIVERLVEDLPEAVRRDNPLIDRTKRTTRVLYRLVDGKAVCTPVKPGPSDLTHTLVEEGLEEGALVVVGPYKVLDKLKHEEEMHDEAEDAKEKEGAQPEKGQETEGEKAEGTGEREGEGTGDRTGSGGTA